MILHCKIIFLTVLSMVLVPLNMVLVLRHPANERAQITQEKDCYWHIFDTEFDVGNLFYYYAFLLCDWKPSN